jgi:hypothetical protein
VHRTNYLKVGIGQGIFRGLRCCRARFDLIKPIKELTQKLGVAHRALVRKLYRGRLGLRNFPRFSVDGHTDLIARRLHYKGG